jgi:NitT/TauT family transport system ATP-binding protein
VEEAVRLADRVVTMTAGPSARIKDVFAVDLPRPRDPEDPAVLALQRRARDSISEEVRRTMQAEVGAAVA